MRTSLLTLLGLAVASPTVAQAPPKLPDADRIRIAEAFHFADALGNRVWPDWDKAPFPVLLVMPDHEFLVRHPKPPDGFALVGDDDLLKGKVWSRKRTLRTDFLATFPLGGTPTIVIGQAENTESKTSTGWVVTLLHEHFHQLQFSQPRYYADVDSLGLARGDTTGMWTLNYAFPYTTPVVKEQFSATARALGEALAARPKADFGDKFAAYLEARKKFKSLLSADDYKYFAFQVWQEGIARYTECHLAELADAEYKPTKEFQALKDYRTFKEVSQDILGRIEKELAAVQLDKAKRTIVYNFGAAEGLVLDRARPGWRKQYFEEKFTLDKHFRPEK